MDGPNIFKELNSPFILVIFGATGDLAQKKLIPALFALYLHGKLPSDFYIIGFSRRALSNPDFHKHFEEEIDHDKWNEFKNHLFYQSGSFENDAGYLDLDLKLREIDDKTKACVARFFYLATPPDHYETILDKLVSTGLSEGCGHEGNSWTRIIVEKPFGKDLETARHLDKKLSEIFEEKQIFRVDHYLGKETVQNLLAFRFANSIFEPVWNKEFIDHVQITFADESGIGNRGRFFDGVGELRDVAQNHLMQLLAAVAMEQPKSFTKEDIRDARAELIKSIRLADGENSIVRGQYGGYRQEKNVEPDSDTETFVAMKLFVDTPRFENIPFYIRAGKKMPKDIVEISIVFIQTCHILFKEYGCPEIGNVLTFRIQPNEGINLRFIAKSPGEKLSLAPVNMHFNYHEGFGTKGLEAYEKILLDIFSGDQILFNRSDELESSWKLITEILNSWSSEAGSGSTREKDGNMKIYREGEWGPEGVNELIEKDNRKWIA